LGGSRRKLEPAWYQAVLVRNGSFLEFRQPYLQRQRQEPVKNLEPGGRLTDRA